MRNGSDKKLGNVPLMVLGMAIILAIAAWLLREIVR